MKTPRVSDFDPNATVRKLKSSMEDLPPIEKPKQDNSEANVTPDPLPVPPPVPVRVATSTSEAQPKKRQVKTRHPFDIYFDQYEALRDLSYEDKKNGGNGSMSAMVRDALDRYITERKNK